MEAPMNNLYIGLLRLENRAAFFACKGFASDAEGNRRRAVSYVSTGLACLPRDANTRTSTAEERLSMSTHGQFANPITQTQIIHTTALRRLQRHPPRRISSRSFFGCKLTVDGGRFRMATKKRDNTQSVVSPYNSI